MDLTDRDVMLANLLIYNLGQRDRTGVTPLHIVAELGHLTICQFILENVQDKHPMADRGMTPLHFAVIENKFEVFKVIFENVEDKNPMNDKDFSPFHVAAEMGRFEICKLFVDNLEDINPCQKVGGYPTTPLHEAEIEGHHDIADYIKSKLELHACKKRKFVGCPTCSGSHM